MTDTMQQLPKDDPRVIAFAKYAGSEDYQNTAKWALEKQHTKGSLWAAFIAGYEANTRPQPLAQDAVEACAKVAWRYDAFDGCDNIGVMDPETGERLCDLGEEDCLCAMRQEVAEEIETKIRALTDADQPAPDGLGDDEIERVLRKHGVKPTLYVNGSDPDVLTHFSVSIFNAVRELSTPALSRPDQTDAVREALEMAAKQFDFYAESHKAKGTAEADVKALTNSRYAGLMKQALATLEARHGE